MPQVNPKSVNLFELCVATNSLSLDSNLIDLNIALNPQNYAQLNVTPLPLGDSKDQLSELDLALNTDLTFLTALTSSKTLGKKPYFASYHRPQYQQTRLHNPTHVNASR